jgi:hypothetical protein
MYDYSISLPNGYRIIRFNADEFGLAGSEGTADAVGIDPTIDGYAVLGGVVAGHAEPPREFLGAGVPAPRMEAEFFVVDTRSGYVWQGTDRSAWLAELRKLGVNDPPLLKSPTFWDSLHF